MKIVMIELSTDQDAAIAKLKNLYGQWWTRELQASWRTGDYSYELTNQQVAALQHLKNSIGNYEKEPILANLKSKKGNIEPIVQQIQ
ncbi:hypothetical protein [Thiolapillus sp.]|uniref:hypothetical protein n=1 Tax=Thiolapillus sp. TaxID=2017437 RepID=UPI003AF8746D